jgi:carbonic anhydrase
MRIQNYLQPGEIMKYRGIRIAFVIIVSLSFVQAGHNSNVTTAIDPNQIIERLLKGNGRFVEGVGVHPHQDEETRFKTSHEGQKPMVSILSCSDSRVPLEAIFDVGIGDLFVVRVAGNIADRSEIGSLEYGVGHLGTPLLMVIGHTKCGAVTAVVKGDKVGGNIVSLIDNIAPAVQYIRSQFKDASEDELIFNSIKANVWQSVEDILRYSREIRELVKEGKIKVIGVLYDIESGEITNMGVHYRQEQIIRSVGK